MLDDSARLKAVEAKRRRRQNPVSHHDSLKPAGRKILTWLLEHGKPATCKDIATKTGLPMTTVHDSLRKNSEIFVIESVKRNTGSRPSPLYVAWEE